MKKLVTKKLLIISIPLTILVIAFGTIFYLNTIKNKENFTPAATAQNSESNNITSPESFTVNQTAPNTVVNNTPNNQSTDNAGSSNQTTNIYPDDTYTPESPMPHPKIYNLTASRDGDNIVCSWDSEHIEYIDGYIMNTSNGNRVGTIYHTSGNTAATHSAYYPGFSYVCYLNGYWNGLTTGDLQSNTYTDDSRNLTISIGNPNGGTFLSGSGIQGSLDLSSENSDRVKFQFYIKNVNGDENQGKYYSNGVWVEGENWIGMNGSYSGDMSFQDSNPQNFPESDILIRIVATDRFTGNTLSDTGEISAHAI